MEVFNKLHCKDVEVPDFFNAPDKHFPYPGIRVYLGCPLVVARLPHMCDDNYST